MPLADDIAQILLRLGPQTLFVSFILLAIYGAIRYVYGIFQKSRDMRKPLPGLDRDKNFVAVVGAIALHSGRSESEFASFVENSWRKSFFCDPPRNLRELLREASDKMSVDDLESLMSKHALGIRIKHPHRDQARIFRFIVGLTSGPADRSASANLILRTLRANLTTN